MKKKLSTKAMAAILFCSFVHLSISHMLQNQNKPLFTKFHKHARQVAEDESQGKDMTQNGGGLTQLLQLS